VGSYGPGDGDGFESGVDAERPEETADVVPDRLGAQMELGGDLLRRAALLRLATASPPMASRADRCATWRRDDHPERV